MAKSDSLDVFKLSAIQENVRFHFVLLNLSTVGCEMHRGDIGLRLDIIAAVIFVFIALSRTVLVGRCLGLTLISKTFWISSFGSFITALVTSIATVTVAPALIVGVAMNFSISLLVPLVSLEMLIILVVFLGYLTERLILVKRRIDVVVASKIARYSAIILFIIINVLIYVCYLIAMKYY